MAKTDSFPQLRRWCVPSSLGFALSAEKVYGREQIDRVEGMSPPCLQPAMEPALPASSSAGRSSPQRPPRKQKQHSGTPRKAKEAACQGRRKRGPLGRRKSRSLLARSWCDLRGVWRLERSGRNGVVSSRNRVSPLDAPIAGILAMKFDPRKVIAVGFLLTSVSMFWMMRISLDVDFSSVVWMRVAERFESGREDCEEAGTSPSSASIALLKSF